MIILFLVRFYNLWSNTLKCIFSHVYLVLLCVRSIDTYTIIYKTFSITLLKHLTGSPMEPLTWKEIGYINMKFLGVTRISLIISRYVLNDCILCSIKLIIDSTSRQGSINYQLRNPKIRSVSDSICCTVTSNKNKAQRRPKEQSLWIQQRLQKRTSSQTMPYTLSSGLKARSICSDSFWWSTKHWLPRKYDCMSTII